MIAEIIAVGTELLMGQIVNTDAAYIARRLADIGVDSYRQSVVGDNRERLLDAMREASRRADVLILTGGLGPTDDDITKQTAAEFFELPLVRDEKEEAKVRAYFARNNRPFTENNLRQADMPMGATVIPNDNGTAPGCIIEKDGKICAVLPGPPFELCPMCEETLLPYLEKKSGVKIFSRTLRLLGIGESAAVIKIDDIIKNQAGVTVAPYIGNGDITLRISVKERDGKIAAARLDETASAVYGRLGEYIYTEGEGESLESALVKLLKEKEMTVSFAESCTGGLLAERLTSVSGASAVFKYGFVTYANEAKIALGVNEKTLEKYGAVSGECAKEMAKAARLCAKADVALSVTGNAGPDPSEGKRVGLVYIGYSDNYGEKSFEYNFGGDRTRVRARAASNALIIAINSLRK